MSDKNDNNYEVKQIYIKTASYNLLMLTIPEGEINDKLAYFSREKGLITKSLYDDFLIATCIANINQFLQHLNQKDTSLTKLNKIRAEMVREILKLNEKLDPKNVIINKNHILKLEGKKRSENDILLTENEFWNKDIYKESEESAAKEIKKGKKTKKKLDDSKIKNLRDLPYTPVQKFWKRIGAYITIRQFEEDVADTILSGREFNTRTAFEQYVVSVCIEEVEDLYVRLDRLGLPQRVSPPILVHELYELCKALNPFLDFNVYKDNFFEGNENISDDPFAAFHKAAEAGAEEDPFSKKKKVKLFKHIRKDTLLNLGDKMKERIIGQDESVDGLVDAIQRASIGLKDPDQPIGSFIFTGPTGSGKSFSAKILAEELVGDRNSLVILDSSEYSADHEYAKLIGSPMGYVGHEQGGHLTNAIRKQPFSVILFDEIEKASDKVHQLLLQIMDEARLTDGKGHRVSFKDTIIIMTSNLGVRETEKIGKTIGFGNVSELTPEKREKAIKDALKKKFKPEFLNRITGMINFGTLTKENYMEIIRLELDKLKLNLKLNRTIYANLRLDFDESLHEYIYEKGIDEKYGARPLKRAIEKEISNPIAKRLLKENINENSKIRLYLERGDLKMDIKEIKTDHVEIDNPPFYMTAEAVDEKNE